MAAKCSTGLLALCALACTGSEPRGSIRLLVDDQHLPDVLTESRTVEPPPFLGGNRFLRGWFPWRHQDTQVLVPHEDGAFLEIVNLADHPRTLVLQSRLLGEVVEPAVEVEVAGQSLGAFPLASTTSVPLPAGLPRGRIPIRLKFAKAPDPVVLQASFDRALPPGVVEVQPTLIRQAPNSVVDFTRPVGPGVRLVGSFTPPEDPRPGQRFAILVEDSDGASKTLFEWTGSWLERLRGDRTLSLPLPDEADFLRIRLVAEGTGPAGLWRELGLIHEAESDTEVADPSLPESIGAPPQIVVLYVLDALRADALDLHHPDDGLTPTLAQLASEGLVFDRHLSVAPNTIPSTKSLFTGQAFLQRGHWKLAPDGPETLAEVFALAGYRTGAFSGNGYVSEAYGTSRGFEHLADEVVFQEYASGGDAFNDNAARVQESALRWLDGLDPDERAFLYLHTIHPHNPYDPPAPLRRQLTAGIDSEIEASTRNLLDIKHNRLEVSAQDQERIVELYKGALAYNDQQISLLLDELTDRYPSEEILLIVTSDHGEELFDHDGVLHGYTLYREQLHIPLILWWPGRLQPLMIESPTDNLDLHESLRALLGAPPSAANQGSSFWDRIDEESTDSSNDRLRFAAASSVKGGIFMAQSMHYKLVFAPRVGMTFGMGEGRGRGRDPEYLFDLRRDPAERDNIAGFRSLEIDWMRSRLHAWIERGKYLEMDEEEPVLDEETQERLRALGYLE